jgi:hypothetical protein
MACGILWQNLADSAALSLAFGTATVGAPLSNLRDPQPRSRARITLASGNNAALIVDLGAVYPVDTVALISTTFGAASTFILRASLTDAAGLADLVWSTGSQPCSTGDAANGNLIVLNAAPVSARYLRITLADTTAAQIDIGRLVVGARTRLARGVAYGQETGRMILDRRERNPYTGAEFASAALANPRVDQFTLPSLGLDEIDGPLRDLTYALGGVGDALWIPDDTVSRAELNQRCLWGAINPAGADALASRTKSTRGSRQFRVVERL